MNKYHTIKELRSEENIPDSNSGTIFHGVYFIKKKTYKLTKHEDTYLMIEFSDATGKFATNIFSNNSNYSIFDNLEEESLVKIQGSISHYNNQLSPLIKVAQPFSIDDAEKESLLQNLIEVPAESESELWEKLINGVNKIKHQELKLTVENVIKSYETSFRISSAAISMHHAYRHGLLEHTVHMLVAAESLLPLYKEVDTDLSIAGIILHDIGKILEYEGDISTKSSRAGLLQGHVVLGYKIVRKAAINAKLNEDLIERLEHIILSHQGEKEWGAAAMAATPEAVFVSMIDNLDAKMGMVQRTLRNAPKDTEFSDYLPGLKTKLLLTKPNKKN